MKKRLLVVPLVCVALAAWGVYRHNTNDSIILVYGHRVTDRYTLRLVSIPLPGGLYDYPFTVRGRVIHNCGQKRPVGDKRWIRIDADKPRWLVVAGND